MKSSKKKIPLTICPISNVKIGPYENMKKHPIDDLYKSGVLVTINCDDPAYLLSDICENFKEVVEAFNWNEEDVIEIVKNSVIASFMTEERKKEIFLEIKLFEF